MRAGSPGRGDYLAAQRSGWVVRAERMEEGDEKATGWDKEGHVIPCTPARPLSARRRPAFA